MPGPLELPPIRTAILADVEQAAIDCGVTRDQMTEAAARAAAALSWKMLDRCPSGLEPDSGEPLQPTLKARTTLALGLPCAGLFAPLAWQFTGEVWLCDIGYPPQALEHAKLDPEGLFETNEIIRVR